jgi:hypothetical protein
LESTKNFISEISCLSYERLKVLRPSSEELGNRLQTPTLIGCIFLTNLVGIHSASALFLPAFAAMSEALHYRRFWEGLSTPKVSAELAFACSAEP